MLKRYLKFLLVTAIVITAALLMLSCGAKEKSKIYIIPESEFDSCVKINDYGLIKRLNIDNLEKADLTELLTGEKYYVVMYVKGALVTNGGLNLSNSSEINREKVYWGTKNGCSVEAIVTWTGARIEYTPKDSSNKSNTTYWLAAEFVANSAEKETFSCSFMFDGHIYEDGFHKNADYFYVNKKILNHKQITAEPSIKYLSFDDYLDGDFDGKLKDSYNAVTDEKFCIVIDYKLTAFKDIEETDTASVKVSTLSTTISNYKFTVEELPTADYTSDDASATASFRLNDGGEAGKTYRFIFSVTAQSDGEIEITAEIFAEMISFRDGKNISSAVVVSDPD